MTGGEPLLRREPRRRRRPDRRARAPAAHRHDDQRHRPRPAGRTAGRSRPGPGERQPRHRGRRNTSPASPAVTASRTSSPGSRRPRTPGSSRSRSTPSRCGASTTTDVVELLAVVPGPRLRAAVHRADAAGRRSTRGTGPDGAARPRSSSGWASGSRLTPVPGARQRTGRAVPRRRRPADGRHHRQRLGAVLRQPATGCGSPPTASCATACSPGGRSTCAGRCAPAPAMTSSPTSSWRRCGPRPPATASTGPGFRAAGPADVSDRRLSPPATVLRASGDLAGLVDGRGDRPHPTLRPGASRRSRRRRRKTGGRQRRRRRSTGTTRR